MGKAKSVVYIFSSFFSQSPIDIYKGMTDEQAREMAENLEFKGPTLEIVSHMTMLLKSHDY